MLFNNLTICSVSYFSSSYLINNLSLLQEQDSKIKIRYLVCENSGDKLEREKLKNFEIIPGENEPIVDRWSASKNHGRGLNKLLHCISTRFVLFLDPDFFLFTPLSTCLTHMENENLAFFGAPYYKGRRLELFPAAFCQFIDLSLVDISTLDFMPDDINIKDFLLDVGHKNYLTHKDKKYDSVIRDYEFHSEQQMIKTDTYYWRNKVFGVHLHQKNQKGKMDERIKEGWHRFKNLNQMFDRDKKEWRTDSII